jgi:hypothetical protein
MVITTAMHYGQAKADKRQIYMLQAKAAALGGDSLSATRLAKLAVACVGANNPMLRSTMRAWKTKLLAGIQKPKRVFTAGN